MIDDKILKIIADKEDQIKELPSKQALTHIVNLIALKKRYNDRRHIYLYLKILIEKYIDIIKSEDFGYDSFNFDKLAELTTELTLPQKVSFYNYSISIISSSMPDLDIEWFKKRKINAEIELVKKNFWSKPQIFHLVTLYVSSSVRKTCAFILVIFLIPTLLLLPAPFESFEWFTVNYENYSNVFIVNHILNLAGFFADIDNDFKIKPLNEFATVIYILYKVLFVLLIANYLFGKISEKFNK